MQVLLTLDFRLGLAVNKSPCEVKKSVDFSKLVKREAVFDELRDNKGCEFSLVSTPTFVVKVAHEDIILFYSRLKFVSLFFVKSR